ncbi:Ureidoglycolate lyase [hydrothermal vent metagenome]|uniref:Ureidoglycolate lyase n=1 Tax=hydrothermal vent metagenome TaxID=652676 RepID=A0A3B0TZ22_9ZZZZ
MPTITIEPLIRRPFAEFGDIIQATPEVRSFLINKGNARRFHDLATVVANGEDARAIISIIRAKPYCLPLTLSMLERHPFGSQAFMPLKPARFLAIVAPDDHGIPGVARAFMVGPNQGVNYFANVWHAVLTPLDAETDFLVVDREGEGKNLETFDLSDPYIIEQ